MDFLLFVSYTKNNSLFKNVIKYLIKHEIFIHIHTLSSGESVAKEILDKNFNKDNKKLFMTYIESYPSSHNCLACNKFTTEYLTLAAELKNDIKTFLDQ